MLGENSAPSATAHCRSCHNRHGRAQMGPFDIPSSQGLGRPWSTWGRAVRAACFNGTRNEPVIPTCAGGGQTASFNLPIWAYMKGRSSRAHGWYYDAVVLSSTVHYPGHPLTLQTLTTNASFLNRARQTEVAACCSSSCRRCWRLRLRRKPRKSQDHLAVATSPQPP